MSPKLLNPDRIREIHDAAIRANLGHSRNAFLSGIDPVFILNLPTAASPGEQILVDLTHMNYEGALNDGTVPLAQWLKNAISLTAPRRVADVFRAALSALPGSTIVPPAETDALVAVTRTPEEAPQHSILDLDAREFWARPESGALHDILAAAYKAPDRIQIIASMARVPIELVPMTGAVKNIWFHVLEAAIGADVLRTLLIDIVLRDQSVARYHGRIQKLISGA